MEKFGLFSALEGDPESILWQAPVFAAQPGRGSGRGSGRG
jgi:hypothetical protein